MSEAKKRDYKAEYKKYGSSDKAKKYRAELNAYNRKKGTYGNGDGKDASHKGGKIVGFEEESKNRGRAEKSRLKKEGKLSEVFQKNHFLNLIKQEIDSIKGQIAYAKDALRQKDIEDWEKKEFKAVLKDNIKDLKELIARQKRVSKWKVSEGKLNEKLSLGGAYEKMIQDTYDGAAQRALTMVRKKIMSKYKVGTTTKQGTKVTKKLVATHINNGLKELRNKAKSPGLKKAFQKIIDIREKELKKMKEGKLTEGFDLKKLEDAIKMFQKKIKKQGRVTNARDEDHLKQLIKVYKQMGGRKIKEGKLTEKPITKKDLKLLKDKRPSVFDTAHQVLKTKSAQKWYSRTKRGSKWLMDMQSANLLVQVAKKIKNKKTLEKIAIAADNNLPKVMQKLWKMVKK